MVIILMAVEELDHVFMYIVIHIIITGNANFFSSGGLSQQMKIKDIKYPKFDQI